MTELDLARKAAKLAWDALDMLKEAQEVAERGPAEGTFRLVIGFCRELDGRLCRLEREAEARWKHELTAASSRPSAQTKQAVSLPAAG